MQIQYEIHYVPSKDILWGQMSHRPTGISRGYSVGNSDASFMLEYDANHNIIGFECLDFMEQDLIVLAKDIKKRIPYKIYEDDQVVIYNSWEDLFIAWKMRLEAERL